MAKPCNTNIHCSIKNVKKDNEMDNPFQTITTTTTNRPCVQNWWNNGCHCEGRMFKSCDFYQGVESFGRPEYVVDGAISQKTGPTTTIERSPNPYYRSPEDIASGKSYVNNKGQLIAMHSPNSEMGRTITKRNNTKRNVGIGLGIAAAIAGIFALTKKKKPETTYYDPNTRKTLSNRQDEEIIEVIDEKTGKITTYKNPDFKGFGKSNNIILYSILGVGVLALTIIIIKK